MACRIFLYVYGIRRKPTPYDRRWCIVQKQNTQNFYHKRMKDGVDLQERVVVEMEFNINIDELKLN